MADAVVSNFCQSMQGFADKEEINAGWKNLVAILSLAYGMPLLFVNIWLVVVLQGGAEKNERFQTVCNRAFW